MIELDPRAAAWTGPPALDAGGWLAGARRLPSPHADDRPAGAAVELLVIHAISLPPGQFGGDAIDRLFTGAPATGGHPALAALRGMRVSAHFLVRRDGQTTQFVSCHRRAWHAGASCFEGRAACNDFSVGVELEGSEFEPFRAAQYRAAGALARALCSALPLRAAAGHSEIAPGRKTDPGPLFDWARFAGAAGAVARRRPSR